MATIVDPQNANHKIDSSKIVSYMTHDIHDAKICVGGRITSGSPVVIIDGPEIASIAAGMTVAGNGIPASTTVVSKSGSTITLSANATATGGTTLNIGNMVYVLALNIGSVQARLEYATSGARTTDVGTIGF